MIFLQVADASIFREHPLEIFAKVQLISAFHPRIKYPINPVSGSIRIKRISICRGIPANVGLGPPISYGSQMGIA